MAPHGRAAARAERQVLAHAVVLRQQREPRGAHRVGLDGRVAHRQPADPARRRQVALQQPRRHGQDVGVVVEAVGEVVARQQRRGVDLQIEQVADRVGVLQPVEAMDGRPAGIRPLGRGAVEGGLQPRRERAVGLGGGPRAARRRHGLRPQLAEDLLPDLRVRADALRVDAVEGQVARPQTPVVARDAVAVQHRPPSRGLLVPGGRERGGVVRFGGRGGGANADAGPVPPARLVIVFIPRRRSVHPGVRPFTESVRSLKTSMKFSGRLRAAERAQQVGGAPPAEPRQQDVPTPLGDHQRRDAAPVRGLHRGPAADEQPHRRVRADVRRAVQRRAAVRVDRVDVGAQLQHEPHRVQRVRLGHPRLGRNPSQTRRHHQRRGPFVGRQPRVGAGRGERVHHFHVGVHRGQQERRGAGQAHAEELARVPVLRRVADQPRVGIGPVRQQRLDQRPLAAAQPVERAPFLVARRVDAAQTAGQLRMPGARGPVQRRVAGLAGVGVGSPRQQERRQPRVSADRGDQQRRDAARRRRVDVGARVEQQPRQRRRVLARGDQQRREPAGRAGADVGARGEQRAHDLDVLLGRRPHQRRLPLPGLGGGRVRAGVEQRAHGLHAARPGAGHQRRLARRAGRVRRGARPQQPRHHPGGPVAARQRQGRHAVVVRRVDAGPGGEQPLHKRQRVVVGRPVQGRGPVRSGGVHVGGGPQQRFDRRGGQRPDRLDEGAAARRGRRAGGGQRQDQPRPAQVSAGSHRRPLGLILRFVPRNGAAAPTDPPRVMLADSATGVTGVRVPGVRAEKA